MKRRTALSIVRLGIVRLGIVRLSIVRLFTVRLGIVRPLALPPARLLHLHPLRRAGQCRSSDL